jgi:TPP-dependent pyruvate/acetoin dehydrogenase alpha subunit
VGGSIAAATGAAISASRQGKVAVAFFGDGASNQGYFHECLNFAQVHRLPALFVCENNLYGEFTPMEQVTAGGDIAARARTLGIPAEKVDGNDVEAVHAAAAAAVARARAGEGPQFLENLTYRHVGHSKSDPGRYRPAEEVEAWKARDPLPHTRGRLTGALGVAEADVAAAEEAVEQQLAEAIDRALAAPYPDPQTDSARQYA